MTPADTAGEKSVAPRGAAEEILAELLKVGTGEGSVEVDAVEERVDFDGSLSSRGKGTFGTLASSVETTVFVERSNKMNQHQKYQDMMKPRTLFVLMLEFPDEVVVETVVEVLAAQVRVTGRHLSFEDALFNRQERNIERSSSEIENEDIALAGGLLVETVRDSGSGGLVDNAEDV